MIVIRWLLIINWISGNGVRYSDTVSDSKLQTSPQDIFTDKGSHEYTCLTLITV